MGAHSYTSDKKITILIFCLFLIVFHDQCNLDFESQKLLNHLNLIWIYISHCITCLLKLEITV